MSCNKRQKNKIDHEAFLAFYKNKDYKKAFKLFSKLVDDNEYFQPASFHLYLSYIHGKGTKKNIKKGIQILEELVKDGYRIAQTAIASHYYFGFSKFEQNLNKAVHYYELAALQGCPDAQEALGRIYYHGTEGVSANYDLAFKYWEQASDQGKANAQGAPGFHVKQCCFEKQMRFHDDFGS